MPPNFPVKYNCRKDRSEIAKGHIMSEADQVRVIIVDDHSIVRRGMGAILTTNE